MNPAVRFHVTRGSGSNCGRPDKYECVTAECGRVNAVAWPGAITFGVIAFAVFMMALTGERPLIGRSRGRLLLTGLAVAAASGIAVMVYRNHTLPTVSEHPDLGYWRSRLTLGGDE